MRPTWAGHPAAWVAHARLWGTIGAELRSEHMTREAWIDTLALAWCLVRRPDSLDPVQLEQQEDMVDRMLAPEYEHYCRACEVHIRGINR